MRVVCTIEARMRSSRLPGKVLLPVLGRPLLSLMIERLQRCRNVDAIWVATTDHTDDAAIDDLARGMGVGCFRGSEQDVMDRVLQTACQAEADVIVETTGDCPLIDPEIVDRVVATFLKNDVDYCANVVERTYPRGMDVEVFRVSELKKIARLTTDPTDREHVSTYFYTHRDQYKLLNVPSDLPAEAVDVRLTVDTKEDLELITRVYETLYPHNRAFLLKDILRLFHQHPEWANINRNVKHKSVFSEKSL